MTSPLLKASRKTPVLTSASVSQVYRRVQNIGESPDVRRITRAAPAGLQGSTLHDADAMTVK